MITSSLTTADTENETEALGAERRRRLVCSFTSSQDPRKGWVWGRWLSASPGEREMWNLAFGTQKRRTSSGMVLGWELLCWVCLLGKEHSEAP